MLVFFAYSKIPIVNFVAEVPSLKLWKQDIQIWHSMPVCYLSNIKSTNFLTSGVISATPTVPGSPRLSRLESETLERSKVTVLSKSNWNTAEAADSGQLIPYDCLLDRSLPANAVDEYRFDDRHE